MKYEQVDFIFNPQSDIVINPIAILQQQKAALTKNEFLEKQNAPQEKSMESDVVRQEKHQYDKTNFNHSINKNLSITLIGFTDDLFNKPDEIHWKHYLPMILERDDRYVYLLILLVFITLFIILIN
jgi:hypothetical protein